MKDNALLSCPFCGGKPDLFVTAVDSNYFGVECEACHIEQSLISTRDAVIAKWNRRARPAADLASEEWQPVAEDDLTEIERFISTLEDSFSMLPADSYRLRNITMLMIREVRAARAAAGGVAVPRELLSDMLAALDRDERIMPESDYHGELRALLAKEGA